MRSLLRVRCHDYEVALTGDAELLAQLEPIFVDVAVGSTGDPHVWEIEALRAHIRLRIDDGAPGTWVNREFVASHVTAALSMAVIAAEPWRLHLHAGAVVDAGRALLLSAPSGSGKSTLTCALVAAGARYCTDESVAVEGDGIVAYPKPISVKSSGVDTVERLTGRSRPAGATSWELPASSIGDLAGEQVHDVATVAFNSYVPSQPVRTAPVHRASAVRALLSESQDVEVFGSRSLLAAATLCRGAQCLQVVGGDAAEVAEALLAAHRSTVEPGELTLVALATPRAWPARGRDVASIVIDGRAVLFTPEPARLIELDEAQTLWWLLLDGTSFDQTVEEVARRTGESHAAVFAAGSAAVEAFRSLGVLDGR